LLNYVDSCIWWWRSIRSLHRGLQWQYTGCELRQSSMCRYKDHAEHGLHASCLSQQVCPGFAGKKWCYSNWWCFIFISITVPWEIVEWC